MKTKTEQLQEEVKTMHSSNWKWYPYINLGIINPFFITDEKRIIAKRLSNNWVTCACGELCEVLPKISHSNDRPLDKILANLGIKFHISIKFNDYEEAKEIMDKIELRTSFLLKQDGFRV